MAIDRKNLPHNTEAEKAVLGAMLKSSSILSDGVGKLTEDDFFPENKNHVVIFRAMQDCFKRGIAVDVQTVVDELINAKNLEVSGGPEYLLELADSVVTFANIENYIKIVQDQSLLRHFLLTLEKIENNYKNNDIDNVSDFLSVSEKEINTVTEKRRIGDFQSAREVTTKLSQEFKDLKATTSDDTVTGVPTGFPKMNLLTHGFHKGEFIVIAARPGVGKTALSLNLAMNAALRGHPVAYFSLEMPANVLFKRLVSGDSNVPFDWLQTGYNITPNTRLKLQQSCERLGETKIYVDDTSGISLFDLAAKCRKLKNKEPDLSLVIVDYVGLIRVVGKTKTESRQLEVQLISQTLKKLAMDLEIPVIGVAQLNRNIENRVNANPQLSDLRESGSLEQDADVVMMLQENRMTVNNSGANRSIFEKQNDAVNEAQQKIARAEGGEDTIMVNVQIVKNRSGKMGTVELLFRKAYCKFDSPSKEASEQILALEKERVSYLNRD